MDRFRLRSISAYSNKCARLNGISPHFARMHKTGLTFIPNVVFYPRRQSAQLVSETKPGIFTLHKKSNHADIIQLRYFHFNNASLYPQSQIHQLQLF